MLKIYVNKPKVIQKRQGLLSKTIYSYVILIHDKRNHMKYIGHLNLIPYQTNQVRLHVLCFILRYIKQLRHMKDGYSLSEPITIYCHSKALKKMYHKCFILKYLNILTVLRLEYKKDTQIVRESRALLKMFPAVQLKSCSKDYVKE